MSSILDALRKVEADERKRPIRLPPAEPRPRRRLAAIVAASAFVAGAGVVALVMALRPSAVPEPVLEPGTEVASAPVPAAPAAPVAPPPAAPTPADVAPAAPPVAAAPAPAPAAAVPSPPPTIAAQAAAPPSPGPAASAPAAQAPSADEPIDEDDADPDVPDPITILRPAPQPGEQAEVQVEALPTPAPPPPPIDVLPGPPAGAPEIRVSFLIYSSVPKRRQVSLTIDNGPLVTLHEGQKAGSVSLVRILRDRIHVEHGGRTFSVRAVL